MKCKTFFGKKICKFGSGAQVGISTLPASTNQPVAINIFTAKSCKLCRPETEKFAKRFSPLKGIVKLNVIDVDAHPESLRNGMLRLPSAEIASEPFSINAQDQALLKAVQQALPRDHLL